MIEIKVFANTWGNYNVNGAEGGKWITLPLDDSALKETLDGIHNRIEAITEDGDPDAEWFVNDFEAPKEFNLNIDDYTSIFELNNILNQVNDLEPDELEKLKAILEVETDDFEKRIESLDNYNFYEGETLDDLVEEYIDSIWYDIPESIKYYIDYEKMRRDWSFEGYTETLNGVLVAC